MKNNYTISLAGFLLAVVIAITGTSGYRYLSTPSHIKKPAFEHYHLRMQVIAEGQAVDFSKDVFQREYNGNTCSPAISEEPFDFHDSVDQFVHVHWDNMTGGELLKYYGWNFIGGDDQSLGARYDESLLSPATVTSYGKLLPQTPDTANYYVYVGDTGKFEQKNWNDFLDQDLETFLSKKSNLSKDNQVSLIERLLYPKVYAQEDRGTHQDQDTTSSSEEERKRINNLIGNVVIFAQDEQPTGDQIQQRFDKLVPLQDSACGG